MSIAGPAGGKRNRREVYKISLALAHTQEAIQLLVELIVKLRIVLVGVIGKALRDDVVVCGSAICRLRKSRLNRLCEGRDHRNWNLSARRVEHSGKGIEDARREDPLALCQRSDR